MQTLEIQDSDEASDIRKKFIRPGLLLKENFDFKTRHMKGAKIEMIKTSDNTFIISAGNDTADKRYLKRMILQMAKDGKSFIVPDYDGILYTFLNHSLTDKGYRVKHLDINDLQKSSHYDPLKYICSSSDVQTIANTIIESTNPAKSRYKDDFFRKSERLILNALLGYLADYAKTEEKTVPYWKTFPHLYDLVTSKDVASAEAEKANWNFTYYDYIFNRVKEKDPENYALKCYQEFRQCAAGSDALKKQMIEMKSSLSSRLDILFDERIKDITSCDEMDLDMIGSEKTAIFVSSKMGSSALLPALLYTQALCMTCDNGPNPVPVHFIMDMRENKCPGYLPEFISHICCSKDLFSFSVIAESVKDMEKIYGEKTEEILSACDNICILSNMTAIRFSGCKGARIMDHNHIFV